MAFAQLKYAMWGVEEAFPRIRFRLRFRIRFTVSSYPHSNSNSLIFLITLIINPFDNGSEEITSEVAYWLSTMQGTKTKGAAHISWLALFLTGTVR